MYRSGSSGLAMLLTIVSLLVFAFFAFMGLEYLLGGDHVISLLITLSGMALVGYCLKLACWGKETRMKNKGRVIEVLSLLAIAVLLFFARTPFSQFVYVVNHEQEIDSLVMEARDAACRIDTAYVEYAEKRLSNYERYLKKTKRLSTSQTKQSVASLKRRLLPDSVATVREERKQWLDGVQRVNVWNIATAKNLHYIITASEDWVKQYAALSRVIYEGEKNCEPFTMEVSDIRGRYAALSTAQKPFLWSDIAMAVCCLLIFTYYIQSLRARSRYQGFRH